MTLISFFSLGGKTNPNFHLWVHVIGTTMGMTRSKHSKMAGKANVVSIILIAMVFAYAHTIRGDFSLQFAEGGIDPLATIAEIGNDAAEAIPEVDPNSRFPDELDGIEWFAWFSDLKFQIPDDIKDRIEKAWGRLLDTRPGTIGAHLHTVAPKP